MGTSALDTQAAFTEQTARSLFRSQWAAITKLLAQYADRDLRDPEVERALRRIVDESTGGVFSQAWADALEGALRDAATVASRDVWQAGGEVVDLGDLAFSDAIRARAERSAFSITGTTVDEMAAAYDRVQAATGGTALVADFMDHLHATTFSPQRLDSRSATVGQTESTSGAGMGKQAAAEQSDGAWTKVWHHDGAPVHPRDWHEAMEGEEVPIDDAFSNGLQFPGDPDGDPEETINCTCSVEYVLRAAQEGVDIEITDDSGAVQRVVHLGLATTQAPGQPLVGLGVKVTER